MSLSASQSTAVVIFLLGLTAWLALSTRRFQKRQQERRENAKKLSDLPAINRPDGGYKRPVGFRTRLIRQEYGRYAGQCFVVLQRLYLDQQGELHPSVIDAVPLTNDDEKNQQIILGFEDRAARLSFELMPNPHQPTGPFTNFDYVGAKFEALDVGPKTEAEKQRARAFTYKIYTFFHVLRNKKSLEEINVPVLQIGNRNDADVEVLDEKQAQKVILILESYQRLQHLSLSTSLQTVDRIETPDLDSFILQKEKEDLRAIIPKANEEPAESIPTPVPAA